MYALPPGARETSEALVTGISCPDCSGVLLCQPLHPGGSLSFRCRIGHVYGEDELLAVKEERLENRLWSAVTALEELAALLHDLGWNAPRRARVLEISVEFRRIIDGDRPLTLDDPGALRDPGTDPSAGASRP